MERTLAVSPPSAERAEEAAALAVAPPTPCAASLAVATTEALRLSSGISLAERSSKALTEGSARESARGRRAIWDARERGGREEPESRQTCVGKGPMNGECGGQRCRGCHECRAEGGEGRGRGSCGSATGTMRFRVLCVARPLWRAEAAAAGRRGVRAAGEDRAPMGGVQMHARARRRGADCFGRTDAVRRAWRGA